MRSEQHLGSHLIWPDFSGSYLNGLYNYLLSFSKRTQPLVDVDALQQQADDEFDLLWDAGQIVGWDSAPKNNGVSEGIWCPACEYDDQHIHLTHFYFRPAALRKTNRL